MNEMSMKILKLQSVINIRYYQYHTFDTFSKFWCWYLKQCRPQISCW